jgi:hypothetical protein
MVQRVPVARGAKLSRASPSARTRYCPGGAPSRCLLASRFAVRSIMGGCVYIKKKKKTRPSGVSLLFVCLFTSWPPPDAPCEDAFEHTCGCGWFAIAVCACLDGAAEDFQVRRHENVVRLAWQRSLVPDLFGLRPFCGILEHAQDVRCLRKFLVGIKDCAHNNVSARARSAHARCAHMLRLMARLPLDGFGWGVAFLFSFEQKGRGAGTRVIFFFLFHAFPSYRYRKQAPSGFFTNDCRVLITCCT